MKRDISILQYSWKWWVAIGGLLSHARSVSIMCRVSLRSIVLVLVKFLHEVLCLKAGESFSGGEIVKVILSLIAGHVCWSDIKSNLIFSPLWRWSACCRMRSLRLGCAHYSILFLHFLWLQETPTFLVWLFIRHIRSLRTLQKKLKYKTLRLWVRVGLRDGFL